MGDLNYELNRLAGTTGLDAQGAANVYAGTVGKELVGALNVKAGTAGLELLGVVNKLAGTTGLDLLKALQAIASFTPTQISGLLGWWDASVASSITSVATRVSQWNDLSGTGNHLVQATAGNKPATEVDTLNGLNVIKFTQARTDKLAKSAVVIAQPLTVFIVGKTTSSGFDPQFLSNFAPTEATVWINTTKWSMYAGSVADSAVANDNAAHEIAAIFNGASSKMYLDQTDLAVGNPGASGRTEITLGCDAGGTNGVNGDIAEVLIYNSALSSTNRLLVSAYLKAKWATP